MFDIGFWEILIIGVVGLLVIGPERLPTVATMMGQWVGRLRRFANHMRSEIQQELEAEHLKQVLDNQNREMQSLRNEMTAVRQQAEDATRTDDAPPRAEVEPAGDAAAADERADAAESPRERKDSASNE